jgi:DNA sulfur modification protein DndC
MQTEAVTSRKTAFSAKGFRAAVASLVKQTADLYLADSIPWVVGYSGGKDSTATLSLIWSAISSIPSEKRSKPVYVISTDTMVENPIVSSWVTLSLDRMATAATEQDLPFHPNRLLPRLEDRYWVNLIGKGYPAPRPKFRWCTSRLKINPSNAFIKSIVSDNGEAILVLGTRKAESASRRASIERYEGDSTRSLLSRNGNAQLDRVWVYSPIVDWSNDDVWQYLMQTKNPWGHDNKLLLGMYQGATSDGECPLVVDTSTPSCGDSRFGCYVCTLVDKDKSMQAMIRNDQEKEWMLPLSEFRNRFLDIKDDRRHRDFRRMNGSLMLFHGQLVHGPYLQEYREVLLAELLRAQTAAQALAPPELANLQLITLEEIEEIRRIWVLEKHEFEDTVPAIYERCVGSAYPFPKLEETRLLQSDDLLLLREICQERGDAEGTQFRLLRELLNVEESYRHASRRSGLYEQLETAIKSGGFRNEEEALAYALSQQSTASHFVQEPEGEPYDYELDLRPTGDDAK